MPSLKTPSVRVDTREALYAAAVGHWSKLGYGLNRELGLNAKVKRRRARGEPHIRADLYGILLNGFTVVVEIKSSWEDLRTDKKMHWYLPYCHRMYVVTTEECWATAKKREYEWVPGVGVLVLSKTTGLLRSVKPCKARDMDDELLWSIVLRNAWRGAAHSRRNTVRRRVYLAKP